MMSQYTMFAVSKLFNKNKKHLATNQIVQIKDTGPKTLVLLVRG